MMAMTWQESCVLSVVVGEGWRGSGGWIWRIMWRKAPSWRPPLTTIKIMHIYMINLAKLSFPVSFILHWLALTRAATRCAISDHRMSPDKITSYSFLFREARSDDNFVSGLFISPSPSSCWLGGQKLLRNVWGSIRYVIICYLNTIYAAEGKPNGCVCPTLYR